MFLPHFDVFCNLLLNRRTATWNLFVLYNKELKYMEKSIFIVTDGNASGLAPPTAGVREQWHNRHEFVDARSGLKRTFITAKP